MTDESFEAQENAANHQPEVAEWTPRSADEGATRLIDDMTFGELLAAILRQPQATLAAFWQLLWLPKEAQAVALPSLAFETAHGASAPRQPVQVRIPLREWVRSHGRLLAVWGLRVLGFALALYGSGILATFRTEDVGLDIGLPYMLLGLLIWAGGEWLSGEHARTFEPLRDGAAAGGERSLTTQLILVAVGLLLCLFTVLLNRDNRFSVLGIVAWWGSIAVWVAALAPAGWNWRLWAWLKQHRLPRSGTLLALLAVLLVAAFFRLSNFHAVPPEMTSDHVEKLLDSYSVSQGLTQIFFANNGGRDPIQFYLLALLSYLPGVQFNFDLLKLLTVVEGLISIPLLWWMSRQVLEDDPELGNLTGLFLAALVATSYWHVMLSRLGLRIVLTVCFMAVFIGFFARAIRHNRRGDFIKAGLTLGFGLYSYQAIRMVPVVVVVGGLIAVLVRVRRAWRGEWDFWGFTQNMTILTLLALVVFLPLLAFSLQYPDDFWRRTSGRLLGDDLITTTDEQGNLVERTATIEERMSAFSANIPILSNNFRNALLMYNWKGDVAWITGASNLPAMDVFSGTLLMLGLGAWGVRMVRRRDVVDWLIPVTGLVMVLPSALSIAFPVENPSATRMSGTLPIVYLLAALPLAVVVRAAWRSAHRWRGRLAMVGAVVLIGLSYQANAVTYFRDYAEGYAMSTWSYSVPGRVLRGFAESGGSFGNAFMIAYSYWWDHRAVGIEAGLIDWPNGVLNLQGVPTAILGASQRVDRYQLNPDKELLFFYALDDVATGEQLLKWFPKGYAQAMDTGNPSHNFMIFRVPPLGRQALIQFLVDTGA